MRPGGPPDRRVEEVEQESDVRHDGYPRPDDGTARNGTARNGAPQPDGTPPSDDGTARNGTPRPGVDRRRWAAERPLPPVPPAARRAQGAAPLPPPPYPVAPPPAAERRPVPGTERQPGSGTDDHPGPGAQREPGPLPRHPGAARPDSGPMRSVPAAAGPPAPPPVAGPATPPLLPPVAAPPLSTPPGAPVPPGAVPPAGRPGTPPVAGRSAPPPAPARPPGRPLPPVPPPRPRFVPGPDDTQLIPVLPAVPRPVPADEVGVEHPEGAPGASRGILRAAGAMAVATLVSRITGLARTVVLTAALGVGLVADAYNTSNTLPNIVYELLLGGVLSSVVIPLLVRAQEKDADGGVGYAQRLCTLAVVGLAGVTLVAVVGAPLLTALYGISGDPGQVHLANWLARLLLVEIVFYGVGALATAILNSRDVYGAPAWAPVLNNVVVIATGGLFMAISHHGPLTPGTITSAEVWLLGVGTTLGIAVQSLVLLPLLRRVGVPLRLRWGLRQVGLREAGTLGLWVTAYAAISQVGVIVATNVANRAGRAHALGSYAYGVASLLFQMPYGIIGVALLTALLPRMSRAALRQDSSAVVEDLSLGTRLSALGLLPVTAALIVLAPSLAVVGFAHGQTTVTAAHGIGRALALGAFGLLPMAVTLLQLRVFYAMRDARTPTLIQVGMVVVRVPLLLVLSAVLPPSQVLAAIMVGTSLTYVAGWVIGDVLLRRRLGALRTRETLVPLVRIALASAAAGVTGELVVRLVRGVVGTSRTGSLVTLLVGTVVIGAAALAGTLVARIPEVREPLAAVRARLGRG